MILYYDIYIDDTPLTPSNVIANQKIRSSCLQYQMPRKLDIAKYTLASYSVVKWSNVIIKFNTKNEQDAISFLNYAREIFPLADISRPCSSDGLSYKKTVEKICEMEDDWIFYAPNNDHPLIASSLDHLYKTIETANDFTKKYKFISIVYSHMSEFLNAPIVNSPFYIQYSNDSKIIKNDEATICFVRFNGDNSSCQIVNKNLLRYWFCSHNLDNEKIIRAEDVRKFFITKNQLMIVPKKELCAHFDGYSHTIDSINEILPSQIPPLFIPHGFFEGNIKIRYGYKKYKEGWVNINPSTKKFSFDDDEYGTDLKISMNDLPLFWNDKISEVDINKNINEKKFKNGRNKYYETLNNPWNITNRSLNIKTITFLYRLYRKKFQLLLDKVRLTLN
jgi:hypothetical protein